MGNVVRPDWMFCYVVMPSLHRSRATALLQRIQKQHGQDVHDSPIFVQERTKQVFIAFVVSLAVLVLSLGMVHPRSAFAASDVRSEVRVVGRLPLKLDSAQHAEFITKTKELARLTRVNDEVVSYSCNSDIETPNTYVFEEVWPSEQALKSHLETDHFRSWWSWVEPHLSGELVINIAALDDFHELR
ncbi:MAG: hypothetical protein CL862_09405 [Cyanobium sp. NAT70]|nr:hypothetical protein [Cyanobium sp. NAT70]